jgi:hypothetical protein
MAAIAILVLIAAEPINAPASCGLSSKVAAALTAGARANASAAIVSQSANSHGFGGNDPVVGLWQITTRDLSGTVVDRVFSGWTRDGLEFDQDIAPILTGEVCYGTFIRLGDRTYGLTHPFFSFQDPNSNGEGTEETEGQWDGTSGFFNYTITVSKDGKGFTGKEFVQLVEGPNPYDPSATVLFTGNFTLSATKIRVNTSQLP